MTIFYKNYISLCAKANKAPSAVAEDVGLSRTSPNGWKKGKVPRDATLEKIADYFGVSVEALTNENKPATSEGSELSTTKEELWRYLQTASDEEAQAILNLMKAKRMK